jgi:hypothetical protein
VAVVLAIGSMTLHFASDLRTAASSRDDCLDHEFFGDLHVLYAIQLKVCQH